MKNLFSRSLLTFLLMISLIACSSSNKKLDEQIEAESGDVSVREKATVALWTQGLTKTQREKLISLRDKMIGESEKIRVETSKIKGVFFKTLFDKKDHTKDINLLKDKLVRLNQKKMDLMFDSFEQAKKILGKSDYRESFKQDFGHGFFNIH